MKQQPRLQQLKILTAINFFRYFATTLLIAGLVSRKLEAYSKFSLKKYSPTAAR